MRTTLTWSLLTLVSACGGGSSGAGSDATAPAGEVPIIGGGTSRACVRANPDYRVLPADPAMTALPEARIGAGPVSMSFTVQFEGGLVGPLRARVPPQHPWAASFVTRDNGCDGKSGCLVFGERRSCTFKLLFEPTPALVPATGGPGPFRMYVPVCLDDEGSHCAGVFASFVAR